MSAHDTCVLWLTHRLDPDALREFWRLARDCAHALDAFVLYDDTRGDFRLPDGCSPERFVCFDVAELDRHYHLNHFRTPARVTPGNTCFPLLDFARRRRYRSYWSVEYDVRFTGSWAHFFEHFSRSDSDLLTTTLTRQTERPRWRWWSSLVAPRGVALSERDHLRAFLPVLRLSQRAARALRDANRQGWLGHSEVLVPTALRYLGLSLEDLGGDGELTDSRNRLRWYSNSPLTPGLAPGTFVCPPKSPIHSRVAERLYHPVKCPPQSTGSGEDKGRGLPTGTASAPEGGCVMGLGRPPITTKGGIRRPRPCLSSCEERRADYQRPPPPPPP